MPIEVYLDMINDKTKEQVMPMVLYIEENYKDAVFDEKYSEKTRIPTWRLHGTYIAIGCRKKYISVYFGKSEAVEVVKEKINSPYVVMRKGCVNISYQNKDIPYEAIYRGIDECFQ